MKTGAEPPVADTVGQDLSAARCTDSSRSCRTSLHSSIQPQPLLRPSTTLRALKEAAHAAALAAASRQFTYKVLFTIFALIANALINEQVPNRRKKAHLPDPNHHRHWQVHVLPPPSLEKYQAGWNSGPFSVASVFHIFIVIASSTEHTRKILNSPMCSGPCLVASAKTVLCHDDWVFLKEQAPRRLPRRPQHLLFPPSPLHYLVIQA
ncbi:hypothetical protein V8E36_001496 [Tilletia maclaganii]